MLVEQAIFTSARTQQAEGYHLVARSPGIGDADARELTIWCPSHDALVEAGQQASSLNFFRLASGRFCVSRSAAVGAEYSARRGPRIETYCLVVSAELLAKFGASPKSLYEAASVGGKLCHSDPPPRHLTAFQLPGRKPVFDTQLVSQLVDHFGVPSWVTLLEAAICSPSLGLVAHSLMDHDQGGLAIDTVVTALLNCLPLFSRTEISFTTGLKHSTRRPFRWMAIESDPAQQRHMARHFDVAVFDLGEPSKWTRVKRSSSDHGWITFVSECLRQRRVDVLEDCLGTASRTVSLNSLSRLGNQWLGTLARSARPVAAMSAGGNANGAPDVSDAESKPVDARNLRPHQPHKRATNSRPADTSQSLPVGPAQRLRTARPELSQRFSPLDQAIVDWFGHATETIESIAALWSDLQTALSADERESIRLEYLRYIMSVWNQLLADSESSGEVSPRALDAICLFTGEAS